MFSKTAIVICSSLFLLFSNKSFSHGNLIKGQVSDSTTNAALPGATVFLGNSQVVTTDQLGNFRFDGLEDGSYLLRITFIGYQTVNLNVSISDDTVVSLNIALRPSSLHLDEIVVSGNASAELMMTSINRIDLQLGLLKSSQDVLRMVPGLFTAQHAGGGKAEQIFLRGFDIDHGTDITLTVDGMPVNMVSHAHGQGYADLHFVTPELIDYVDFNKGPYYARIGDFNTAGYANFHTRKYLDNSLIKLEAGRFDTYRALTMLDLLGKRKPNQSAYIVGDYTYTNGPFESPQYFNRINLFGKFHRQISDNKLLSVSASLFKSGWDASGQIPERAVSSGMISRFGAIDDTEGGYTGRRNINTSLTTFFEDGSSLENQLYLSNYDFELYSNFTYFLDDSVSGDQIRQKENRYIHGYNATYHRDISLFRKSHKTESGIGFRYDDINGNELSRVRARHEFLEPIKFGDINQINAYAFTDLSLNISNALSINAGVRFDAITFQHVDKLATYQRNETTAMRISPKLNFFYRLNSNFQLYLKNGIGFHSNDARAAVQKEPLSVLPRAYGTDLGFYGKPVKNLLLNAALWQLRLDQEFVYVGDEGVVEAGGRTQRYGVDVSLRYQPLTWLFIDLDANYSHARSIDEADGLNYIPLAPQFTSAGGSTVRLPGGFSMALRYRFIDDRPANEDNSITAHGYFLLDGSITYERKHYQLSLTGTNLLNRDWNEAQFATETRLATETVSTTDLCFTPGDPIFIKVGVAFLF
ncbi:MAG TPA: TonB-dependent receptor [Chryseosolibacter sp.]|nr:TonB-dependent receptor [Chryseosolibacter sp.]